MKTVNTQSYKASRGFTMVELLIGMLVSLFIVAIAFTYMASSTQTFKVQTNDSIIQENARFALEILTQNLRLAGLNSDNDFENAMQVVYAGKICPAGEAGLAAGDSSTAAVCTRDGANNTTDNNSDRLAIDYIVRSPTSTCNGTEVSATDISNVGGQLHLASVFWSGDLDGDGVRSLYCQTYRVNDGIALGTAQALVEGIDRMQVQYGVRRITGTGTGGPIERYQSFTNRIASGSGSVKAIRVALLISSGIGIGDVANSEVRQSRSYSLLDAPAIALNDGIFRQIFSTTILIPNGR